MWLVLAGCHDDEGWLVPDAPPVETAAPAALELGPSDAVWGRDALHCAAPDGSPVSWSVDGADVPTPDGVVPAPLTRSGTTWTCHAPGYPSRDLTPRVAHGNILLVVVDDIGRDRLTSFGGTESRALTPAIDALRERSVVFDRAWATPVCSATRAALYTGRHPHRTGIGNLVEQQDLPLEPSEQVIPEALALADPPYANQFIGKWHLADSASGPDHPLDVGFDQFRGTMANLDSTYLLPLNPPDDRTPVGYFQFEWVEDGVASWKNAYATEATVDAFVERVDSLPEPWFTVLSFNGAHRPWHYPPAGWSRSPFSGPFTPSRRLDYMVESVDIALEKALAAVGPDTTVVFVADNGTVEELVLAPYEAGFGVAKGTTYEAGVNVPLMIAGPLVRTPGVSNALVEVTDLFDTVLAIAGLSDARIAALTGSELERDSVSLLPYLGDPALPSLRSVVYTERFEPHGVGTPRSIHLRAAREDRFKLMRAEGVDLPTADLLFDLGTDPVEGEPLDLTALSPEAAAAYTRLVEVMDLEQTQP